MPQPFRQTETKWHSSWNGPKQDNDDIYVKLIGPGEPLRITTDPAEDTSPAWSPDGKWIAFLRRSRDDDAELLVVPALGGPERKLSETGAGLGTIPVRPGRLTASGW